MAQTIKVETNELTACANEYSKLAESFNNTCNKIIEKCKAYENCWKGSFTKDLDTSVDGLKKVQSSIYGDTKQVARYINHAVEMYILWDKGLISKKDSDIGTADFPDNLHASVRTWKKEELDGMYGSAKKECQKGNSSKIPFNDPKHPPQDPLKDRSCAMLTKFQAEQHGFNPDWYGHGKDVVTNMHSTNQYNVRSYNNDGGNCIKKMIAAEGEPLTDIVVSFDEYRGDHSYGHVLYIDQIVDGKVYWSDNDSIGKGKVATVDEFLKKYEYWNGAPTGCARLVKKTK